VSKQNTGAAAGGFTYRPTHVTPFDSKLGSVDGWKVSTFHGRIRRACHIRATPRPDAPYRSGSFRGEAATPPTDRPRRGRAPTSVFGVRNTVRGHNNALAWRTSRGGAVCEQAKPLQLSPLSTRILQRPSRSHYPTHTGDRSLFE
jgi:hypothetical protein